jgi:hypothetical protein
MPAADTRVATPLRAPRVGLLSAASLVDLPGVKWGYGAEWYAELPKVAGVAYGARAIKCDPETIDFGADEKAHTNEAYPFSVYGIDWCSTIGSDVRNMQARARRVLAATESFSVAKEFWAGAISTAESLTNRWLGHTDVTVVSAPTAPQKALAALDQTIAEQLYNGPGMVHCTVETLNRLLSAQALRRDGDLWRTAFGNVVVADAGYSGVVTGENPATTYMVATTMVEVSLGPVRTVDLDSPEGLNDVIDHTVNDVLVWAERDVIVMHEPEYLHHAVAVDLT